VEQVLLLRIWGSELSRKKQHVAEALPENWLFYLAVTANHLAFGVLGAFSGGVPQGERVTEFVRVYLD